MYMCVYVFMMRYPSHNVDLRLQLYPYSIWGYLILTTKID